MRRALLVLVTLAIALGATVGSAAAAPAPRRQAVAPAYAQNNGACLDSEELAFLTLINNYRAQNGLGPLQASHKINGAADYHSSEMADYNYFSHTLLNGVTWSQNMTNFGYTANTYRGENIAAGNETASATFLQWKNSPSHNANMLSAHYHVIGIGRAYNAGSTYKWYWTTDFGGYVYSGDAGVNCSTTSSSPSPSPSVASGTPYKIVRSGRTAGSYYSGYAYDGKPSTFWYTYYASTPPRSAYVWFDLGAVKPVGSIQWVWSRSGYADSVRIQVSADGRNWTTLKRVGNAPAGAWQSLATSTDARYVRFVFYNPNKDPRLGFLGEVKITS